MSHGHAQRYDATHERHLALGADQIRRRHAGDPGECWATGRLQRAAERHAALTVIRSKADGGGFHDVDLRWLMAVDSLTALCIHAIYHVMLAQECFFEGRPYRSEYLIVKDGKLAGVGAHSYKPGSATSGAT